MKPVILLSSTLLVLASSTAQAGHVNFYWDDCLGNGGVGNRDFVNCASATSTEVVAASGSFILDHPMTDFRATEIVIDLEADVLVLPDWWIISPMIFPCRTHDLDLSAEVFRFANANGACTDPFAGNGIGGLAAYTPGGSRGRANAARIIGICANADPEALAAGTEYYGFRLMLRESHSNMTEAGSCAGCGARVALVLNSMKAVGQAVDSYEDNTVPGTSACITWQGASPEQCGATPARNRTWGSIKSLYR